MATEEGKAAALQELEATFGMADTNQDGFLDHAEFAQFLEYHNGNLTSRGVATQDFSAIKDKMYEFFNHETPADGISKDDIKKAFAKISAAVKARLQ